MSSLKKIIPTIILLIAVYAWYFFVHAPSHPSNLKVLGASTNIVLYEEPDAGHDPIINAINSAKREILVEVYLLSDKEVISALEDARSRGVDVKVMMEQHPFGGGNLNPATKTSLDSHGVATEWSNPSFALTHEKSIVIDESQALILSQNLTASAFTKNREHDVFDTDPDDVAEVRNIFIDDWERKSFIPPNGTNLIESPDNSRGALTSLIESSTKSIDAETEDIDDNGIVNLLIEKAKTENVRLLVPTLKQVSSNQKALSELAAGGVHVETISSPYMHAKMILTDGAKAYVGSINFSTQSMDENRELGIILAQADSLQTLSQDFESDWGRGTTFNQSQN